MTVKEHKSNLERNCWAPFLFQDIKTELSLWFSPNELTSDELKDKAACR